MTRLAHLRIVFVAWIMLTSSLVVLAAPADRKTLPGRQVKVATIPIGFGGDHARKLQLAIDHLETAGASGVQVRDLLREHQIETLRDYRHRSRDQINDARKTGKRI